jgi:hypothetical protein
VKRFWLSILAWAFARFFGRLEEGEALAIEVKAQNTPKYRFLKADVSPFIFSVRFGWLVGNTV